MTAECLVCNLCTSPGRFADATEVHSVRSNVREFCNEAFVVWRCPNCRSLHARDPVDLDRYYANYVVTRHELGRFNRIVYGRRIKWLTRCGVEKRHRVLEFGCGKGLFVDYLQEQGFTSVRGYDRYVPRFADEAWRDEVYDAILSYDVIEHVEDPREFLREQIARLAPGGVLNVTAPNAARIAFTERDASDLHAPYHRHIPSLETLAALGRRLGLETLHVSGRSWMDTRVPFVNWRFVKSYVYRCGNLLDVVVEPVRWATILTSPSLLFAGLFGYDFPSHAHMCIAFRKPGYPTARMASRL